MNIKYDNVTEIRNFIQRQIEASTRLKELELPIAEDVIMHQVLNQLHSSFDQL